MKKEKKQKLSLQEVSFLLDDIKRKNLGKKISKKDYKQFMWLTWLYSKLIKQEAKQLLQVDKNKIGHCPSIPHKHTRCNNDKYELYQREKNDTSYYIDYYGLDVDYTKPRKTNKKQLKKVNKKYENNLKLLPKIEKVKTTDKFYQDIKKECEPYIKMLINSGYSLQYIDDYIKTHSFGVFNLTDFI